MLKCPTCSKPVDASMIGQPGSTFPFCCDRCRLRDLGKWFDGVYQVAVEHDSLTGDEDEPVDVWIDPRQNKPNR